MGIAQGTLRGDWSRVVDQPPRDGPGPQGGVSTVMTVLSLWWQDCLSGSTEGERNEVVDQKPRRCEDCRAGSLDWDICLAALDDSWEQRAGSWLRYLKPADAKIIMA